MKGNSFEGGGSCFISCFYSTKQASNSVFVLERKKYQKKKSNNNENGYFARFS